ncbi:hypothetical protein H7K09_11560 [Mycolicibacterium duvalii]|uniref:Uncharacterized protein n=1 Tax=Mycolicibacterium duvalii TaxID=39688 RepID=A0A7I7K8B1_9MYCO|nr:hypothetical protein [Mycolicibacterium duvalii]MCV7368091.1 hypothetical protein [Mycolicibacterium duvalii]BBX19741.1 hypothetical protein MDUV_46010 [Mycolicibacterium duvalii]
MKNFTIAATAAAGLSIAVLGLAAPAAAAPSGSGDAGATISALEAEGNRVIVNRQGSTPLGEATVVSVRPGPEFTEWVWDAQGDDRIQVPAGRTYFVDVK